MSLRGELTERRRRQIVRLAHAAALVLLATLFLSLLASCSRRWPEVAGVCEVIDNLGSAQGRLITIRGRLARGMYHGSVLRPTSPCSAESTVARELSALRLVFPTQAQIRSEGIDMEGMKATFEPMRDAPREREFLVTIRGIVQSDLNSMILRHFPAAVGQWMFNHPGLYPVEIHVRKILAVEPE